MERLNAAQRLLVQDLFREAGMTMGQPIDHDKMATLWFAHPALIGDFFGAMLATTARERSDTLITIGDEMEREAMAYQGASYGFTHEHIWVNVACELFRQDHGKASRRLAFLVIETQARLEEACPALLGRVWNTAMNTGRLHESSVLLGQVAGSAQRHWLSTPARSMEP